VGISTNGILFYGICFGNDAAFIPSDDPWGWKEQFSEWETEAGGAFLSYHCHEDHPMWYAAIKGAEITAYRGDERKVPDLATLVPEDASERLRAFCEKIGAEFKEPAWYLVAFMS